MANFALDVAAFAKSFDEGAELAVKGATIKLWAAIIKATPVDEGRARANWFSTGQQASVKLTSRQDTSKDGTDTAFDTAIVIDKLKDWSTMTLTNNLPYIGKLEFGGYGDGPKTSGGYSTQAPQGMVRMSIKSFNKKLNDEAKRVLPK